MALFGYGSVPDRAFVAFEQELDEGAWKAVSTKKHEDAAKGNAAALLSAPTQVIWKFRLRWGIGAIVSALGATSLVSLDDAWDAAQRRLFHRIAEGVDAEDRAVRDSADRLRTGLLAGTGTAQTQLDFDSEVDFGRQQLALTQDGGPLAADAKKLKLADALADIAKTTESLGKGLGRGTTEKRKAPSRRLREAVAECAASFNAVHDEIAWFISRTPKGSDRDTLTALMAPLEALLERNQSATAPVVAEGEAEPAPVEGDKPAKDPPA